MKNISACLVVYNEEKHIKRCLESLKNAVDEIIVVHDGECDDKTIEICREYTDKIFILPHIGIAEPHRPFSFKQASRDWILQIDADEYLSEKLLMSLPELVRDGQTSAYELLWPLWDGQRYLTKNWPYKRCLFKKDKLSYLGIANAVAGINGPIRRSGAILEHRPSYNNFTWQYFKIKWLRWAKLQADLYLKKFSEIKKFNCRDNDWPAKVKLRIKWPLILIPGEFAVTFFKNLFSGGYKEGLIGYKVSLMLGGYRVMVNYFIYLKK